MLGKTIDKNTAELLENPALEGKTYFEAMPTMLKEEGLAFNQKQFNDALGFVNDYFELENDLEPFGINSASKEEQKENAEEPDYEDEMEKSPRRRGIAHQCGAPSLCLFDRCRLGSPAFICNCSKG